jgi:antirestriction protein ArdC
MSDKAQQLTATIADSIKALCTETDEARQSELFKNWLNTLSRFHKYSFGNCILIAIQAPDASRVAGFHTWKELGRNVKKGEKGIRILAPIVRKVDEQVNGNTETVSRPVGFRCVSVFSYEQTEGRELPELEYNAKEGGDTLLPMLEKVAAELKIDLVYKAIESGADGLSRGGSIEIEESLDTPARCGVLAHELAHELLAHKARRHETTKQQRETEAEAVAYAVLSHFGMRLESRFYLASYGITAEMFTASIQNIANTAKTIITMIDNHDADEESAAEGSGALLVAAA